MENNKLIALAGILLIAGGIIYFITFQPEKEAAPQAQEATKTNAELALETAQLAKETFDDVKAIKDRNDSIWDVTRKRMWVYRIGLPTTDKVQLLETYNRLKNVSNIKIFQLDRKTFFIYKDDNKTEQELKDSLDFFHSKFSVIDSRLEVVDLMAYCKHKEEVMKGKGVKIKKEGVVLDCNRCE